MDKFFDSMLQEIDRYTGTVNLEGENIIPGCREMTKFLKEKMVELKARKLSANRLLEIINATMTQEAYRQALDGLTET